MTRSGNESCNGAGAAAALAGIGALAAGAPVHHEEDVHVRRPHGHLHARHCMADRFITRGFTGRRRRVPDPERLPPGQYVTPDFPVLSAGPTPRVSLDAWTFRVEGQVREPAAWTWPEFRELPATERVADIHCVTKWSKLDTRWRGVSVDTLLERVDLERDAAFVCAFCYGGYTTNLPLDDVADGKAFVTFEYEDEPLAPEHGGPARLVVPHLYFWKSAKWVRGLRLMTGNEPGFWEQLGYHDRGDPWKEQRYSGD